MISGYDEVNYQQTVEAVPVLSLAVFLPRLSILNTWQYLSPACEVPLTAVAVAL